MPGKGWNVNEEGVEVFSVKKCRNLKQCNVVVNVLASQEHRMCGMNETKPGNKSHTQNINKQGGGRGINKVPEKHAGWSIEFSEPIKYQDKSWLHPAKNKRLISNQPKPQVVSSAFQVNLIYVVLDNTIESFHNLHG